MAREPETMYPEDTNVVVQRVRKANRRKYAAIAATVTVVLALGVTWAVTTSEGCRDRFIPEDARRAAALVAKEKHNWLVHPGSPTARVIVRLTEPGMLLVDDEEIGELETETLELEPGLHTLRVVFENLELRQVMTTRAGQEFHVDFDREKKDVELLRVPAPEQVD